MPSCSPELEKQIQELFPNDKDLEASCLRFLKSQGYKLRRDWQWDAPEKVYAPADMTRAENLCVNYMIDEWDFGGVVI
jgi:hypothetical protein